MARLVCEKFLIVDKSDSLRNNNHSLESQLKICYFSECKFDVSVNYKLLNQRTPLTRNTMLLHKQKIITIKTLLMDY